MEPMKKVEVVVDSVYLNRVLDILERLWPRTWLHIGLDLPPALKAS